MEVIVNTSLSRVCFSIWPPVAVNILYFLVHAIDGLGGGGGIVESLYGKWAIKVQRTYIRSWTTVILESRGRTYLPGTVSRKIRTCLDLLSIPQPGREKCQNA